MCCLAKSVIKGSEMSIRFITKKKKKRCSPLEESLHSGLSSPMTEYTVLWRTSVAAQKLKSFTHSQRRAGLGITLLPSLRCSANAEGWSGATAFEFSLALFRDHFTWAATDNSYWKETTLKHWIVWTGDLLYGLFNKKNNISYFGVLYTHCT